MSVRDQIDDFERALARAFEAAATTGTTAEVLANVIAKKQRLYDQYQAAVDGVNANVNVNKYVDMLAREAQWADERAARSQVTHDEYSKHEQGVAEGIRQARKWFLEQLRSAEEKSK